jgi:hypothetical protein
LQDRLVKELRLAGARTLAEGNALLPALMADYNARFGTAGEPEEPAPAVACWRRSGRRVCLEGKAHFSRALTLQYDKVIFILESVEQAKAAIGKRVTVVDYPDGQASMPADVGRALRYVRGFAPARRPTPTDSDICKWQKQ